METTRACRGELAEFFTVTRDETERARYLIELLDTFNAEGVEIAFVRAFASYNLPNHIDPREDWDMAS